VNYSGYIRKSLQQRSRGLLKPIDRPDMEYPNCQIKAYEKGFDEKEMLLQVEWQETK